MEREKRKNISNSTQFLNNNPSELKEPTKPTLSVTEDSQSPVTLTCVADGKPPPYIAWIKNGQVLKNAIKGTTLFVNESRTYHCKASTTAELAIKVTFKDKGSEHIFVGV